MANARIVGSDRSNFAWLAGKETWRETIINAFRMIGRRDIRAIRRRIPDFGEQTLSNTGNQ